MLYHRHQWFTPRLFQRKASLFLSRVSPPSSALGIHLLYTPLIMPSVSQTLNHSSFVGSFSELYKHVQISPTSAPQTPSMDHPVFFFFFLRERLAYTHFLILITPTFFSPLQSALQRHATEMTLSKPTSYPYSWDPRAALLFLVHLEVTFWLGSHLWLPSTQWLLVREKEYRKAICWKWCG